MIPGRLDEGEYRRSHRSSRLVAGGFRAGVANGGKN